jgi:hypothetical protein
MSICDAIVSLGVLLTAASPASESATHGWRLAEMGGRHVVVSPADKPVFLLGVNHLDDGAPSGAGRAEYLRQADERLRAWGFNNLGYGAPLEMRETMPFIDDAQFTFGSQYQPADSFRYVDVFDSTFQRETREAVRTLCAETAKHPNLIGYYWSDTPRWDTAMARRRRGDDWVSALRRLPATAPGKQAYVAFIRERYGNEPARFTAAYGHAIASFDDLLLYDFREFDRGNAAGVADDRAFLGLIARELYRVSGEAFREFAPGKLILGERYKLYDHPDEVLLEAAKWIDVLSIQPGPTVGPMPGQGRDEVEFDAAEFDRLHKLTRKPILICDHQVSFRTAEHPVTLWHQFSDEREALAATARFVRAAAAKPYIIGYQHCQYCDMLRPDRGNMLKQGLVRGDGRPYGELTSRLAELNREIAESFDARMARPWAKHQRASDAGDVEDVEKKK